MFHRLVKSKKIKNSLKPKFIYVLSDAGVEINYQNNSKQTCLHIAVIEGLVEIVLSLLQCGADLTLIDNVISYYFYTKKLNKLYFFI